MDKPRILYIGFGIEPFMRGGAITYQESLLESLQAQGWEVFFYLSAPRYTYQDKPRIRRRLHRGITILELVDPPYHYGHNYAPIQQCHHPDIERLSRDVLDEVRPDIVHIHELQFHTAALMDIVVDKGIPALKTMHNYYDLCPEGNLMYQGKEPCTDYDDGQRCMVCLSRRPLFFTNFKIRLAQALPLRIHDWLHRCYLSALQKIRPQQDGGDTTDPVAPYHAEEYRGRKSFFVERLNRLDAIHCSAQRAAEIFCDHGIAREKVKVIPLSVRILDSIKPQAIRGHQYPVVFGFIGGRNLHKGYHVLVDAFSRLDQTKCHLIVWGDSEADPACRELNVEFREKYNPDEINELFDEVDVFVVPSVWEEIFGIIGIECRTAGIPVIGSRIGGIPDWLTDGESGFLVTPGHPEELARVMERFVSDPALISEMQRRIKPWKRFDDHVNEMLGLYRAMVHEKQ